MPKRKLKERVGKKYRIVRGVVHNPLDGELIEKYNVGQAEVYIVERDGEGYYLINEPHLTEDDEALYNIIMDKLSYVLKPARDVDPKEYLNENIMNIAEELGIREQVKRSMDKLSYYLTRDIFGYERIDVMMRDPEIEEISSVSYLKPVSIVHRYHNEYYWMKTNIGFEDSEDIDRFVRRLTQLCEKSVSSSVPIVDAISPEGHRISVAYQDEVTLPGSTFCIRKFTSEPLTITKVLDFGTLTPLMTAYLWLMLDVRGYIMIIGAMATGKTTMLSCLTNLIHPNWKVCTIEDTPEVVTFHDQWLRFKSRKPLFKTDIKPIELVDLVIASLRHRVDFIIVGETRGVEIQGLVQAAALGHGCLTTFHGGSAWHALRRMSAPPLNVRLGDQQSIWAILLMKRLNLGNRVVRRVTSITEVHPSETDGDMPKLIEVFKWNIKNDSFEPSTPEEVVKRSVRLERIMETKGWDENRLIEELRLREQILKSLVERKIFRYTDVVEHIKRFYVERGKV